MMYGQPPVEFGTIELASAPELMFVQYMPIKMAWSQERRIPQSLLPFKPLIDRVSAGTQDFVYLTAKHFWVSAGTTGNRPGWHGDGFGTDDQSYVWSDSIPTEFCIQPFTLTNDHEVSMREMEEQANPENIQVYPVKSLLGMDAAVIHRPGVAAVGAYRVFAKISVSTERYDLAGNAHNYLFDYDWPVRKLGESRNCPVAA